MPRQTIAQLDARNKQLEREVRELRTRNEEADRLSNQLASSFQKLAGAFIYSQGDRMMFDNLFPELRHVPTYGEF